MKMTWCNKFGFDSNPYLKLDPFKIELDKLEWNRSDMSEQHTALQNFVEDLKDGQKASMRVLGAIGSGKTWFARIIEKYLLSKEKDAVFIYTKVPKLEPLFSNVYSIAIKDILDDFERISENVEKIAGGLDEQSWLKIFEDEDLARGLCAICAGGKKANLARSWLMGNRLSGSALNAIDVVDAISSDFKRYQVLVELFKSLSKLFPTIVLVIDELENAPVKLAGGLSDSLRDMLSEFYEKFGLVCLYTAQSFDEWYEIGYTEALTRRIDYDVSLPELNVDAVTELVEKHHSLYRTKGFQIKSELFPFNESGINMVFNLTSEGRRYPGYFFPNCEAIIRSAYKEGRETAIDDAYVKKNGALMPYSDLAYQAQLG